MTKDINEDEELGASYQGLQIVRGKRHCKIVDENDEVIFRTTNLRDAEHYLELREENDRLHRLLESRGVAPHRIYLLAIEETKRGSVNLENVPATEVVIVAKADDEAVVVRHLSDGREEIVELSEIEPIEGGAYLQGPEVTDETVHLVLRYDRETEAASIAAFRNDDQVGAQATSWLGEEAPGGEYSAQQVQTEGDVLVYRAEISIDD